MNLEPLRELIERWRKESDDFERDGDEGSAASYYNCADELEGVIAALGEGQEVGAVAPSATAEPFCRDCADNDGICPYSGRACDPNVDPKTALKLMAENAAEIGLTYEYGAPSVMVSRIGDYHAIRREMACVLYDDKKIAECYTNEDAVFVGAAIRAHTSTGQTSDARDAELIRALRNQYVSERTFRFQCENGMDYENARAHADSAVNQFEASFIAARERHTAMRQEAGDD